MNRDDITSLVETSASRFGDRNPQQAKQLEDRLRKASPSEALHGLVAVFSRGKAAPSGSAAQELAGQLLAAVRPVGSLDLRAVLQSALSRYELSVEQFPGYLAALCGPEAVRSVLEELSQGGLSEQERKALEAMLFWLRNPQHYSPHNVA